MRRITLAVAGLLAGASAPFLACSSSSSGTSPPPTEDAGACLPDGGLRSFTPPSKSGLKPGQIS